METQVPSPCSLLPGLMSRSSNSARHFSLPKHLGSNIAWISCHPPINHICTIFLCSLDVGSIDDRCWGPSIKEKCYLAGLLTRWEAPCRESSSFPVPESKRLHLENDSRHPYSTVAFAFMYCENISTLSIGNLQYHRFILQIMIG